MSPPAEPETRTPSWKLFWKSQDPENVASGGAGSLDIKNEGQNAAEGTIEAKDLRKPQQDEEDF